MIGELPTELEAGGKRYAIRPDFRDCLAIMEAYQDDELSPEEKVYVALTIMYRDFENMPQKDYSEAYRRMIWFLNGGVALPSGEENPSKPLMNWKQDAPLYFPAINKASGREVRQARYMHFWTFLGYYYEIGEGLFATVISIRDKLNNGKKLEKHEREFYRRNKNLVDIKKPISIEDREWIEAVEALVSPGKENAEGEKRITR